MSSNNFFGVGIVGCGLIGSKRAASLGVQARLIACADTNHDRAVKLSALYGADSTTDWRDSLSNWYAN